MPFVHVRITEGGVTAEQKSQIIRKMTDVLAETLGKNPASTMVVIDEVLTDNWGFGGKSVTELQKAKGG